VNSVPGMTILEIFRLEVPKLVRVSVLPALGLPTDWAGKIRLVVEAGEQFRCDKIRGGRGV